MSKTPVFADLDYTSALEASRRLVDQHAAVPCTGRAGTSYRTAVRAAAGPTAFCTSLASLA
jgi:hypothetical protein